MLAETKNSEKKEIKKRKNEKMIIVKHGKT
jgi:hypothetical protein